jgi:hypothetical protein
MDFLEYYNEVMNMDVFDYALSTPFRAVKFILSLIGIFLVVNYLINGIFQRVFKRSIQNNNTVIFLSLCLSWTLTYTVMKNDRDTLVEILVGCSHIPNAEFIKPLAMCTFPVETDSGTIKVSVDKSYNFILPMGMER